MDTPKKEFVWMKPNKFGCSSHAKKITSFKFREDSIENMVFVNPRKSFLMSCTHAKVGLAQTAGPTSIRPSTGSSLASLALNRRPCPDAAAAHPDSARGPGRL